MNSRSPGKVSVFVLVIVMALGVMGPATAKTIKNREYRFRISVPGNLARIEDHTEKVGGTLYYDTVAHIIMLISQQQAMLQFRSVDEYIDCSREELELQARTLFGDPDLQLLSCSKAARYAKKIAVLHFRVTVLPTGFDTHMIFFIHHAGREIQFAFTYKKANEEASLRYINSIMKTLQLR